MTFLRALWFNLTFYGANLVLSVSMLGSLALPRRKLVSCIYFWLASVAWVEKHAGGIRYRVLGRELIPQGSCIVACKHQSEWETFKLHLLFNDPAVVLKKELLRIPVIGWYMTLSGSIPIDRSAGMKALHIMLSAARKAVKEGRPIVIFPEGTRVAVGDSRPFKSGIAALYKDLRIPIVPVALNSGLLWPKNAFYKKPGLITVEILPSIPPGLPRDEMMRRLRDALETATARLTTQK